MPHIIVIHGPPAVGKSTIVAKLKQRLPKYSYVDRPNLKRGLKPAGTKHKRRISKIASFAAIKELIKLRQNFIVEEMEPQHVRKKLARQLRKYKYNVHGFRLTCSLPVALLRDAHRQKKSRPHLIRKLHKEFSSPPNPKDIVLDTERLNINQCVRLILKELKS